MATIAVATSEPVEHCKGGLVSECSGLASGVGETCAKVILFGEHSVVYGYSAVAIPLKNLKMRATVKRANAPITSNVSNASNASNASIASITSIADEKNNITLKALDFCGPLQNAPKRLDSVKTAIYKALQFVNWRGEALQVETACDFPPERGLGSSAAAAGAVILSLIHI